MIALVVGSLYKIDLNVIIYLYQLMSRSTQMKKVQEEALELFTRKNKDYGDAFADYGPIGVIVRMGDKIRRLSSITNNGITLVKAESIRDTLIDLHNYAAMAVMLLDEKQECQDEVISKDSPHF